jgi:hypothetical protein
LQVEPSAVRRASARASAWARWAATIRGVFSICGKVNLIIGKPIATSFAAFALSRSSFGRVRWNL